MWGLLTNAISGIVGNITDSYNKKQELKDAKHERELKRITDNDQAAGDADIVSLRARTWSDEYLLILTTAPFAFLFFEPVVWVFISDIKYTEGMLREGVVKGFEAMKVVPEYMWYALALIYIDVFGFRRMLRLAIENLIMKKFGIK